MIAIVTPNFNWFYEISQYSGFDGMYCDTKWVSNKEQAYGRNFDGFVLGRNYYEIKNISEIVEYLEMHGAKKINL